MNKLERKFGKYAIKNLSLILVICYAVGYLLQNIRPLSFVLNYMTLNPYAICHGQIWRIFTWIIVPPSSFSLLTLITLFFYYSIGHSLENTWGDFLYNIYIFMGMLFTVIGAFILYAFYALRLGNGADLSYVMNTISYYISTYYVNMSIFLAFAATFPNAQVLLMFIIPVKVKWLGIIYALMLVYEFFISPITLKVIIFMSLLNFGVFYLLQKRMRYGSASARVHQAVRRHEFKRDYNKGNKIQGITKHKCAICGKTEESDPNMEFRFCSKCNGNYEYCSDHLFTHTHVE